jgi:DtxR family Mn-dependent transcriptional regulator
MRNHGRSESSEMYLKSLAELGGETSAVPIPQVAERLSVSAVSASEMIKRLAEEQLIEYLPYRGVLLTPAGRRLANDVIRRQRLWECFLVEHLEMDWAGSVDLACDLEHATAAEVSERLAAFLGHPAVCPHGNPIPDEQGESPPISARPLSGLEVGRPAVIRAIVPENREVLSYLGGRGLRPGRPILVLDAAPFKGPLTLRVADAEIALGLALAELVLVEPVPELVEAR